MKDHDLRGWFFRIVYILRKETRFRLFNNLVRYRMYCHGVRTARKVKFYGSPTINRFPGSEIIFGDECIFRSFRNSVAMGLYRPCSFVTTRPGARIEVGKNSGGTGITVVAADRITIGQNVMIGAYTTIVDNDFHNSDPSHREQNSFSTPTIIEDNVFIGFNCMILKGVVIGRNSVIGANSVVVTSIPPNSVALGNPCKVIMIRKWDE
jgi:acetyltransferase-like isoleucine patch superfamily enzyme